MGLQPVSDDMTPERRCSIGVGNIELLIDIEWRSNLLLGVELSRMKWSGDFTRDTIWSADDTARGWPDWLKRREFRLGGSDRIMDHKTANTLIMWSVLYGCFADENERRAERGLLPLPLPSSVSQLRPYASMMRRVDDWQAPDLLQAGNQTSFDMEPPFAALQPEVIAAWEAAWETIPPDKRIRKGEPVPPAEPVSRQYFREREGLKQLKSREDQEMEEAKQDALTVGQQPAQPTWQQSATASSPAASTSQPRLKPKPAPPRKTEAEVEAERHAYQVRQDARDYRLKLMNLQQSAESLRAFLKNTLAREGSEVYLTELRNQEAGIYSVEKDIPLLRDAVVTLQEVFRLATEPYSPPAAVARGGETESSTVTIDV